VRKASVTIFALIVSAVMLCSGAAYADTHWVNLSGSNEAPYTSYATGAHKIQDAIDVAVGGDKVRITAGLFRPDTTVFLKDSIAVIGAGRDSTMVYPDFDSGWPYGMGDIFRLVGSTGFKGGGLTLSKCTVRGNKSQGKTFPDKTGIGISYKVSSPNYITDNKFIYCFDGVRIISANVVVENNEFDSNTTAIAFDGIGPHDIGYNTIYPTHRSGIVTGIYSVGPTYIHHNKICTNRGWGIYFEHVDDSLLIYNNLVVTKRYWTIFGYCACPKVIIQNNTFVRVNPDPDIPHAVFFVIPGIEVVIENNVFSGDDGVVEFREDPFVSGGGTIRFGYNNIWGLDSGATGLGYECDPVVDLDTVGNIRQYPMFTDDILYHLQQGSPLIDAGNPSILDPDGTRSDIGQAGGPGGWEYEYVDHPPNPPESFSGYLDEQIILWWQPNYEADVFEYRLYRDTIPGNIVQEVNLLAHIDSSRTCYVDSSPPMVSSIFYILTAVDTVGLESTASDEVVVYPTGILEESDLLDPPAKATPSIIGCYPNPFNTTITIVLDIPDVSVLSAGIQMDVYDILGRKVTTIHKRDLTRGDHLFHWRPISNAGEHLPTGVYFIVLNSQGTIYSPIRRVVLIR